MNSTSFGSASDLTQYVNDNTIPQANIVAIRHVDGRWWLFWF